MTTNLMVYKDAASESNLEDFAIKIHEHHNETVKFMARKQIEVGRILLKARAEFRGDKEFGQWREESTPINSRQTATKLMELARQCETGRITDKILDSLPTSTIFELLAAPTSVMHIIAAKLDEGEVPSQKAVREIVKEQKPEDEKSKTQKVIEAAAAAKLKIAAREQDNATFDDAKYNDILQETLAVRISKARLQHNMSDEWAWVVFGIPPFAEGIPHEDVIQTCYNVWFDKLQPDQQKILTKAWSRLCNFYGE